MLFAIGVEVVLLVCLVYLAAELVLYSKKVDGLFVEKVQRHKGKEGLSKKMQYAARVIYDFGGEHYNACSQDDVANYTGPASGAHVVIWVNPRKPDRFLINRGENILWIVIVVALMLFFLLFV